MVSFNNLHMKDLQNEINSAISKNCASSSGCCTPYKHAICEGDVADAIKRLKHSKGDGSSELSSDHFLFACKLLNVYLSLLFTMVLRHGLAHEAMLVGVMVPIPKGRWSNLCISDNCRAITLSSIIGKLLDIVIMTKEEKHLSTSNYQFSFKKGLSTGLCTAMVQETISYFIHNGSNVYGLLLDASKAFDRLNYYKLFKILLTRGVCPTICRLLLNMYLNQTLKVRWNDSISEEFRATNGVKQGGVISPTLYCIYMDGLLNELELAGVGRHMGGVFAGAFAYADDITLLAPNVQALRTMIDIIML